MDFHLTTDDETHKALCGCPNGPVELSVKGYPCMFGITQEGAGRVSDTFKSFERYLPFLLSYLEIPTAGWQSRFSLCKDCINIFEMLNGLNPDSWRILSIREEPL